MKCEILEVAVFAAPFLNKNFLGFTGGGVQCTQKCVLNIWGKESRKNQNSMRHTTSKSDRKSRLFLRGLWCSKPRRRPPVSLGADCPFLFDLFLHNTCESADYVSPCFANTEAHNGTCILLERARSTIILSTLSSSRSRITREICSQVPHWKIKVPVWGTVPAIQGIIWITINKFIRFESMGLAQRLKHSRATGKDSTNVGRDGS